MLAKLKLGTQDLKKIQIGGFNDRDELDAPLETWSRNADWLEMPTIGESEQKVALLVFVQDNGSNYVTLKFAGDYTVDWGDGVSENFLSGVTAYHNYDYSSLTGDTITTDGGILVKQVMIQVTPQVGSNLTLIDLVQKHSSFPLLKSTWTIPIADMLINMPSLTLTASTVIVNSVVVYPFLEHFHMSNHSLANPSLSLGTKTPNLKSFEINCSPITSLQKCCSYCPSLIHFNFYNTSGVTSMLQVFNQCYSLQEVVLPDLPSVTSMSGVVLSCSNLRKFTMGACAVGVDMGSAFGYCNKLKEINFNSIIYPSEVDYMFAECLSLRFVPKNIDFSSTTVVTRMFSGCDSITNINLNLPEATNCNEIFSNCQSLRSAVLRVPKATSLTSAFSTCGVLINAEIETTSALLGVSSMFTQCESLRQAPYFDTSNVTNFGSFFQNCFSLNYVPQYDFSKATTLTSAFENTYSLKTLSNITIPLATTSTSNLFENSNITSMVISGNSLTAFADTVRDCYSLVYLEINSMGAVSSFSAIATGCGALQTVVMNTPNAVATLSLTTLNIQNMIATGFTRSINLYKNSLSRDSIVALFNSLGTAFSGATITVSNNPGTADLTAGDLLIATSKGFTVVT